MPKLKKTQKINAYTVQAVLKQGIVSSARVSNEKGESLFLKIYPKDCQDIQVQRLINSVNKLKNLQHKNIARFIEEFDCNLQDVVCHAVVFEFVSGEGLSRFLIRKDEELTVYQAKILTEQILDGISYLHGLEKPIVVQGLSPNSIMLDYSTDIPTPKITDLEEAVFLGEASLSYPFEAPFYVAPECLEGKGCLESDVFSVAAIFHALIFAFPPWFADLSFLAPEGVRSHMELLRSRSLKIFSDEIFEFDEGMKEALLRALSRNPRARFHSSEELKKGFLESKILCSGNENLQEPGITGERVSVQEDTDGTKSGGFKDVAGMEHLKEQLQSDVIDVLKDAKRAEELGLHLPNGLLFYGPPGCGKTFFAKKFAEEIGCYFIYVSCSDVASPFIHGGQKKIAELFDEARKNAPSIIFFDEIEAMIKDRKYQNNVSEAGEVNEFLTQLNNSGHKKVIAIGATNRPELIDSAALRAGRLEYKYYIPLPDFETRKSLFRVSLRDRKTNDRIDFDSLAKETDGFVCADITLIVEKAARLAFKEKASEITVEHLKEAISKSKPSVKQEELDQFSDYFGGLPKKKTQKIGFV